MDEVHLAVYDGVHVILDVLRVGGDDRAVVVVVGLLKLIPFVGNGRVEDMFHTLVDQPLHMTVGQFRRITLGFARDGLDAQFIDLPCGSRGEYYPEAEFCEKCKPERIVLVHVQHAGDADLAARGRLFGERFVIKVAVQFIVKEVRHGVLYLLFAQSPLAAVSGNELAAAAEVIDGQTAGICTSAAFGHSRGVLHVLDLVDGEHGRAFTFRIPLAGDESRTEGAHDAGDVRADGFAVRDLLKAPEDCVIVEGTALYDDVVSEFGSA